jgi:hypothetical protein
MEFAKYRRVLWATARYRFGFSFGLNKKCCTNRSLNRTMLACDEHTPKSGFIFLYYFSIAVKLFKLYLAMVRDERQI